MKSPKYYFLKAKYKIFKHLSVSQSIEFRNATAMFPAKYEKKWYVKYANILGLLSLFVVMGAILGIAAIIHFLNPPLIIHYLLDGVIIVLSLSISLFLTYTIFGGILSDVLKTYIHYQIKNKYNSDVQSYLEKMDDSLTNLEKFNIIHEKEQLEKLLNESVVKTDKPIKRVKI